MAIVVRLDQYRHGFQECGLLRGQAVLALVDQLCHRDRGRVRPHGCRRGTNATPAGPALVSRSAASSGDKRFSPLSISCSTAATMWSYSSSVSMALTTMRLASRAYFFGSTVSVALMISTLLSYIPCASRCSG